jgi:phosphate transport system protein
MAHHLHREVERLKKKVLSLSAMTEESVLRAVQAVEERDSSLALRVVQNDYAVDQAEVEVEEECLKILALYQPVAIDLRFIIAVLKINSDLERIADLAVNIAERAEFLATQPALDLEFDMPRMVGLVKTMLRKSLDSLVNTDARLAEEVLASDDEVDDCLREFYGIFRQRVVEEPHSAESLLSMLTCTRSLERIADYTTNIAEDVIYMTEGEIIRHQSPESKS